MYKKILGYLVQFKKAKTIWVNNRSDNKKGTREDIMFKLTRTYIRHNKTYMWILVLGKYSVRWAKLLVTD